MQVIVVSHRFGDCLIPKEISSEVKTAINDCPHTPAPGKTKLVRKFILEYLAQRGWSKEVSIDPNSSITITSVKQRVGLCFQTGNMARMYADLIKLQVLYLRGTIESAIMIIPTQEAAQDFGSNIANQNRLERELKVFDRAISVPIMVFGIDKNEDA